MGSVIRLAIGFYGMIFILLLPCLLRVWWQ